MISFFRKIRQSLLKQNKASRYAMYAFGEIMLVMIGILLALALNEWNTQRKNQDYLSVMLQEIHKDLKSDQYFIYSAIEPRQKYAEEGLKTIKRSLHAAPKASLDSIVDGYAKMKSGFQLTTSSGSYDALKAKGLEIIQNDSLRLSLFDFYELTIPRSLLFIHGDDENRKKEVRALEDKILTYETYEEEDGRVRISSRLKDENLAYSQTMYKIVNLMQGSIQSKRYRIEGLKESYARVSLLLEKELSKRSIPFTSFDATQVKLDF